jgi:SAM-dependent methyltransferase
MNRIEEMGFQWRGFDLNPSSSQNISAWDLTNPCPAKYMGAGAAILLDVIEHCVNPGLALSNIARVLAPDGRLIITMPNPRWSRSRLHALRYGYPTCFTQGDLDANHHVFTPWPHILEKMLGDAGFEIDDYVTLDGTTGLLDKPISYSYPFKFFIRLLLVIIERLDRSACGMSYGIIARRMAGGVSGSSF